MGISIFVIAFVWCFGIFGCMVFVRIRVEESAFGSWSVVVSWCFVGWLVCYH